MPQSILILILLVAFPFYGKSQDLHWTQFNAIPLYQNPAQTGNFQGDLRWTANYRDQWRSVTRAFSTVAMAMDGRLLKHRNLSFGGAFLHDVVGDGALRTLDAFVTASYQLQLSADSTHLLQFGVNAGMNNRMVDWNAFKFGTQFNGFYYDPSLATNESYSRSQRTNFNSSVGLLYQFIIGKRKKIEVGYAIHNLARPNQGFYEETIKRPVRHLVHAQVEWPLADDWDLIPALQFQYQGNYWELMWGSSARLTLEDRMGKYRAVYFGLWNRPVDALMISGGVQFNSLFVGLSYDINYNKLVPASRTIGAIEIAARYTIYRFKPKKIYHRICPDYI